MGYPLKRVSQSLPHMALNVMAIDWKHNKSLSVTDVRTHHTVLGCTRAVAASELYGTRWRSWLRHCATNRKVAGSIPDVVVGIFH